MKRLLATLLALAVPAPALALVPNDTLHDRQWYLGQVDAFGAWDVTTGNPEVVVAVLDTGIDLDHPDLVDNLWRNQGEVAGDGLDNDGNGFVDDIQGWDFVDHDPYPQPDSRPDDDLATVGHGTFVAGIIGAVGDNAEGLTGLAWRVKLMPVRVLGQDGEGVTPDLRAGIEYAVANGAAIINISSSGLAYDPALRTAVNEAYVRGVLVVAAAGNTSEGGTDLDVKPSYPACYQDLGVADWVLGVAASTRTDAKAAFSNYGAECVDIVAPGTEFAVVSLQNVMVAGYEAEYVGYENGTSMAAPVVSGAAALLKSVDPTLTPGEIKRIFQLSVDPLAQPAGTASFGKLGPGRLNVSRALATVAQVVASRASAPPPVPSPVASLLATRVVVAADAGYAPRVSVYDGAGTRLASFLAYAEGFRGGVRVALADLDGDGATEIVTVPGPGGGPHVRVFALDGTLRAQFFAFDPAGRSGLQLSVADADRDGLTDILVRAEGGAPAGIRAFRLDGSRLADPGFFVSAGARPEAPAGAFGRTTPTFLSLVLMPEGKRLRLLSAEGGDLGGFLLAPADLHAKSLAASSR